MINSLALLRGFFGAVKPQKFDMSCPSIGRIMSLNSASIDVKVSLKYMAPEEYDYTVFVAAEDVACFCCGTLTHLARLGGPTCPT